MSEKAGLSLGAALALCKGKGITYTSAGLRYLGLAHGFAKKVGHRYQFDEAGLLAYIGGRSEVAPAGWIPLSEYAARHQTNLMALYKRIKRGELEARRYGPAAVLHIEDPSAVLGVMP